MEHSSFSDNITLHSWILECHILRERFQNIWSSGGRGEMFGLLRELRDLNHLKSDSSPLLADRFEWMDVVRWACKVRCAQCWKDRLPIAPGQAPMGGWWSIGGLGLTGEFWAGILEGKLSGSSDVWIWAISEAGFRVRKLFPKSVKSISDRDTMAIYILVFLTDPDIMKNRHRKWIIRLSSLM